MTRHLLFALSTCFVIQIIAMIAGQMLRFHWSDLATIIAMVIFGLVVFFSISGDGFSRVAEYKLKVHSRGSYESNVKKFSFLWNPILTGSLIYMLLSLSFPYFFS